MDRGKKSKRRENTQKQKMFDILSLTCISGITPNIAAQIHVELDINNIDELYVACKQGRLAKLDGWGEEKQSDIIDEIELQTLWIMSQCNKIRRKKSNDFQQNNVTKNILNSFAKSQGEKNKK